MINLFVLPDRLLIVLAFLLLIDLLYLFGLIRSWLENMDEEETYQKKLKEFSFHIVSTGSGSKDYLQQVTDSLIRKTEWFTAQFGQRGAYAGLVRLHFFGVLLVNFMVLLHLFFLLLNGELQHTPVQTVQFRM